MLNTLNPCRLFITGASRSGTTTLGRAIANQWAVPHADADDYFWQPTSPPYREKRTPPERISLMREVFLPRSAWVLSAWAQGYDDPDFAGRNLRRHEQWLSTLPCPVLRIDSSRPVDDLVHAIT
ncbi:hypothetical protein [Arthrobacter sp. MW3 TE3886]|uniref:hypothetical protein n=1 Tax=Arthrobacter sp. MW3 TE3886 TaxID=3156254 RepID=UPI003515AA98